MQMRAWNISANNSRCAIVMVYRYSSCKYSLSLFHWHAVLPVTKLTHLWGDDRTTEVIDPNINRWLVMAVRATIDEILHMDAFAAFPE
jgi:hypothetical protein